MPILHIADATAMHIQLAGPSRVGLLGTNYTMEQDIYKSRIESIGISVLIPNQEDLEFVNRVIF